MTERTLQRVLLIGGVATAVASLASLRWGAAAALSVAAGGAWNLANLWCLSRALGVWINPQQAPRRVRIGWFLVKFPLLYAVAFGMLKIPGTSLIGFGVGFTMVLGSALAVTFMTLRAFQASTPAHGR